MAEELISPADLTDSVEALSHRELATAARSRKAGAKVHTRKCHKRKPSPQPSPMATVAGKAGSSNPFAPEAGTASDSEGDEEGAVVRSIDLIGMWSLMAEMKLCVFGGGGHGFRCASDGVLIPFDATARTVFVVVGD